MKTIFRVICVIGFSLAIYASWAGNQWVSVGNQTGVLETCRWKEIDGINHYDCIIRLSNGESGAIGSFVLDDENHKNVTVKVEVNKLRKKRKRYAFISSS